MLGTPHPILHAATDNMALLVVSDREKSNGQLDRHQKPYPEKHIHQSHGSS